MDDQIRSAVLQFLVLYGLLQYWWLWLALLLLALILAGHRRKIRRVAAKEAKKRARQRAAQAALNLNTSALESSETRLGPASTGTLRVHDATLDAVILATDKRLLVQTLSERTADGTNEHHIAFRLADISDASRRLFRTILFQYRGTSYSISIHNTDLASAVAERFGLEPNAAKSATTPLKGIAAIPAWAIVSIAVGFIVLLFAVPALSSLWRTH